MRCNSDDAQIELNTHRNHFFIPPNAIEFRAFTHGLMPKTVPKMMQHFVTDWQTYGVDAWNEIPNHWLPESNQKVGWWTLPTYLGDSSIAPLLHAPQGTCIMQPNVHWTTNCIFSDASIFEKRKEVIFCEEAFPSVRQVAQAWAKIYGLNLKILPLQNGRIQQELVLDCINENTALVVLSHVGFLTGEKLADSFLKQVAQKVHRFGGLCAIDGFHAVASIPIDVTQLEVDFYFGGLLKEGCGSSGNGFVYIREGVEISPALTGWFGNNNPFAFHPNPQKSNQIRERFLGGTTAIAPLYHAVEGLKIFHQIGIETIRKDSLEKTELALTLALQQNLNICSPIEPEKRSAMVILEVPHATQISQYLKQQHIFTDSRKDRYLRFAPFVWNTQEEILRLFETLNHAL